MRSKCHLAEDPEQGSWVAGAGSFDLETCLRRGPGRWARPGVLLEPKWDGFRAALIFEDGAPVVYSRNGTDLSTRFPELLAAAAEQIPSGCVLDGEAVVWGGGGTSSPTPASRA
ncbi:hypothetical protein GCM10027090_06420 [Sinomonas soli]